MRVRQEVYVETRVCLRTPIRSAASRRVFIVAEGARFISRRTDSYLFWHFRKPTPGIGWGGGTPELLLLTTHTSSPASVPPHARVSLPFLAPHHVTRWRSLSKVYIYIKRTAQGEKQRKRPEATRGTLGTPPKSEKEEKEPRRRVYLFDYSDR